MMLRSNSAKTPSISATLIAGRRNPKFDDPRQARADEVIE
jgi:hypothetical protein